ncbi:MAG: suppressor of fused domain protein [Crocinitomicaceae bacterium]|nr:suppressor of fused domain protein [Crocinitomicaceae bacterium]
MANNPLNSIIRVTDDQVVHENKDFGFTIHSCKIEDPSVQLLITNGLRNHKQEVNKENEKYQHIELYVCLPDYWNLSKHPWPLHWLNRIAQVPQKNNTWFGAGDTIPAGNPPSEVSPKFSANHFILSPPIFLSELLSGPSWKNADFQLLSVIPIYQKELDFKLKNSHTMLFNKFDLYRISEKIDTYRNSACPSVFKRLLKPRR